jgi:hypothetical protein
MPQNPIIRPLGKLDLSHKASALPTGYPTPSILSDACGPRHLEFHRPWLINFERLQLVKNLAQ